jgi:hypothetical protein
MYNFIIQLRTVKVKNLSVSTLLCDLLSVLTEFQKYSRAVDFNDTCLLCLASVH